MTRAALAVAALYSVVAALIHLYVVPEHFREWWGYGVFFVVAASAQLVLAVALLTWPHPWVLIAGIVGNLAIIALWAVTRMVEIPGSVPGLARRSRLAAPMSPPRRSRFVLSSCWSPCCGRLLRSQHTTRNAWRCTSA